MGVVNPGKSAMEMLSLKDPSLDWVSLSKGMGVDAVRVDNLEDLVKSFKNGLKETGLFNRSNDLKVICNKILINLK